ncbi:DeoR/GlpR family DNA-binding transcription regulator [Brachybacterium sp. ACRRE]|uniref:DeoR/GlpR family DNA-binding transcription regulator n=1 Tax=Brachybacterium sp. ACRRE TaxID=2918184 RepID=UPI001EF2ABF3|nr:DeoR/GlpR family DNA-binding transcription regulator [Brachybacterium sp. ACRRE]MCG7308934.1 DeoR/GlpR family DNA-binding transcription regulator [Brachybacterium sp. ACRRE]
MLTDDRRRGIVAAVRRRGSVPVADLAQSFAASEATIRRDLEQLAADGQVRRVRGGACDPRGDAHPEPDPRRFEQVARDAVGPKREMAQRAAAQVADGDVIALDIGTTVAAMCPFLLGRSITVVTSSLAVVRGLAGARDVELVVLGGILRPTYGSLVGPLTESALRQIRVDRAFLGTSGIRADGTVLDTTPSEVPIKRGLLDIASVSCLLADHEKLPGTGYLEVAPLARFDQLVTDRAPSARELDLPPDSDLEVLTP